MNNGAVTFLLMSLLIISVHAHKKTMVFYMHDIVTGKGQTAFPVVAPNGTSGFGTIIVFDDIITETSDPKSTVLGKGQGMYVNAALDSSNVLLIFTAILTSPQYNQSTINFQGADLYRQTHRDISVVGGTGVFKFARGSATIQTFSLIGPNANIKFTVSLRY